MRSTWEHTFARYLDRLGLYWEYEPQGFKLSNGKRYLPDFRVDSPLGHYYVELHRMKNIRPGDASKIEKIRLATKELPLPLIVLDQREMRQIECHLKRGG